ncbi:MAG: helix-turn-helix transcriptional regulator [Gammaproteobacteria bacterium]|nr:helix-turn-helix transcriptional regulator [Gammaproteobacteria bacterium]
MSPVQSLVDALKRALRAGGVTYADVARDLGLSEASVKRMFSRGAFTLERFEAVCRMVDLGITDLVRLQEEGEHRISHLTRAQEEELVADTRLLLVALCVRNRWGLEDIVREYEISVPECVRLLARLDRLRLIALQPDNRVRALVARDFRWLAGGPIERFFERHVQDEFLDAAFAQPEERRLYLSGAISPGSAEALARKLDHLAAEFAELQAADAPLPLAQKRNVGLVLATRAWELAVFAALRRRRGDGGTVQDR